MQRYKTIYFADYPATSSSAKNLTLAFGDKNSEVYEAIKHMSSEAVRQMLGHPSFESLAHAAMEADLSVNTYSVRSLRRRVLRPSNPSPRPDKDEGAPVELSLLNPIQATFRGGQGEPLHAWYPYLEGYSPAFVETLVRQFAPNAKRILDPFSGGGTTPITVARMGRDALYCEVNPLMQFITDAKAVALKSPETVRTATARRIREFGAGLKDAILSSSIDPDMDLAYDRCFEGSQFFYPHVYQQVLQLRVAIDLLYRVSDFAGRLVEIAALAVLVPVSLMIRRGDLRYKNRKELARSSFDLVASLQAQIEVIAADLERLEQIEGRSLLISEDARALTSIPFLGIDAVITSPPYLNGTNYFRNTKIELWFLRALRDSSDLAEYRYRAVTSGINDVTNAKVKEYDRATQASETVRALVGSAYDQRIPRMVSSYFAEMSDIISAVRKHLTDDASIIIDIGNSSYGGVLVPTDRLLSTIIEGQGFCLEAEHTLRTRRSRGGQALHEVVLHFRRKRSHAVVAPDRDLSQDMVRSAEWEEFKTTLPHKVGQRAQRNWGHPLHSLCSYQGKLKPSLAEQLVKTFLSPGDKILDPFGGVGTIPFEAALLGARSWSIDISPLAYSITAAKIGRPSRDESQKVMVDLEDFIRDNHVVESEYRQATRIRFNGQLSDYFESRTFDEILLSRRYFQLFPPRTASECLVFSALLHILHGNRPYALSRNSHPITPFAPTGPFEYRNLMMKLGSKVARSLELALPESFVAGLSVLQDATLWWPMDIDELDAVMTSPPFYDSTRFYLANWMRLWFSGWEFEDFRTRPLSFVDERQKLDFKVYESIFRQARERLKAKGVVVLHLGKSAKCDMAERLRTIAQPWFRVVDVFDESVVENESHGIRDKGAVTSHQFLVLQ